MKGKISVNDQPLSAGDGLGLLQTGAISLTASENAEFLLFDLAA